MSKLLTIEIPSRAHSRLKIIPSYESDSVFAADFAEFDENDFPDGDELLEESDLPEPIPYTEAQQMIETTEKFLAKNQSMLTADEIATTKSQIQVLQDAITSKDKDGIQHQTEQLNNLSRPYAERLMDAALKDAMHGKKVL